MRWRITHLALMLLASCQAVPAIGVGEPAAQPFAQQAYVWQRDWDAPVRQAVSEQASHFSGLVVLNAEVTWSRSHPRLVRVPVDYAVLRAAGGSVGLALRIGPYAGPFHAEGEPIESLCELAAALVAEAGIEKLAVCELQIDFDCADSKLAGYQVWIEALAKRVSPTPIAITALPSWLAQPAFKSLAAAAGGYVLQVHSLERPRQMEEPFTLCDPAAARRAVDRAGRFGVPFRVALPTYGYTIAFDRDGRFIGLSAEGPARQWPAGAQIRDVRADPEAMAGLMRFWSANRPETFQGIIWYRLPVATDVLNWHWPTLAAVMKGRTPRARLRAEAIRPEPGLIEIRVANDGDLEGTAFPIRVRWGSGRLLAADALQGFELTEQADGSVWFEARAGMPPVRLGPGKRRAIGWLRLGTDQEVQIENENRSDQ